MASFGRGAETLGQRRHAIARSVRQARARRIRDRRR